MSRIQAHLVPFALAVRLLDWVFALRAITTGGLGAPASRLTDSACQRAADAVGSLKTLKIGIKRGTIESRDFTLTNGHKFLLRWLFRFRSPGVGLVG